MATTPQVSPGDRYQTHLSTSSIGGMFITVIFMFSTLYGLSFYYTQDTIRSQIIDGNVKSYDLRSTTSIYGANNSGWTDFVAGFSWGVDQTLELIGILNPFSLLLKPQIESITLNFHVEDLYEALNLFILRPVGWIFTFIFWEFIFNYIRGRST